MCGAGCFDAPAEASNLYYVEKNGTDSGDCATDSMACRTINYALRAAYFADSGGQVVTINLGAGTWQESVSFTGCPFGYQAPTTSNCWVINGSGGGPAPRTIWNGDQNNCGTLIVNQGTSVLVQNLEIEATASPCQSAIYAQLGGNVVVGNGVTFGPAVSAQINLENASLVQLIGNYWINGGAAYHVAGVGGGSIGWGAGIVVTIQNGPTYSAAFISLTQNESVNIPPNVAWSGGVDGNAAKYVVTLNSSIQTNGQGCESIPGNSPGLTGSGGQCQ